MGDQPWSMIEELNVCIEAKVSAILEGAPGIGKTQQVYKLGKLKDLPVEVFIGAIHEPQDLTGFPTITSRKGEVGEGSKPEMTKFYPLEFVFNLVEAGKGILFLDELSCSPPSVQSAMLRVALERVVGYVHLPDDVVVLAAMNPPEMTRGGYEISPPLANRFIWLKPKILNPVEWAQAFATGFADNYNLGTLPPEAKRDILADPDKSERIKKIKSEMLIPFFMAHPNQIQEEKLTGMSGDVHAYPTPRMWDIVCKLTAACFELGYPIRHRVTRNLINGGVGEGTGAMFIEYAHKLDLPDPKDVLENPKMLETFLIDKNTGKRRPDRAFAILSSVVNFIKEFDQEGKIVADPKKWEKALILMGHSMDAGIGDMAVMSLKDLYSFRPKDAKTPTSVASKLNQILSEAKIV